MYIYMLRYTTYNAKIPNIGTHVHVCSLLKCYTDTNWYNITVNSLKERNNVFIHRGAPDKNLFLGSI